jgi:hypothetical protein
MAARTTPRDNGVVRVVAKQRTTDGSIYLEVWVRSAVRPRLSKMGIMEHGEHSQVKERQVVGALAGAMAEQLCEQYRDTVEPSAVARAAMDAYDEMVEETPVLKKGDELPRYADRNFLKLAKH